MKHSEVVEWYGYIRNAYREHCQYPQEKKEYAVIVAGLFVVTQYESRNLIERIRVLTKYHWPGNECWGFGEQEVIFGKHDQYGVRLHYPSLPFDRELLGKIG